MREWLVVAAACVFLSGCPRAPDSGGGAVKEPPRFEVFKGGRRVLTMRDKPGPIVSTAAPPPDGKPATHPWLTAASEDAASEDELRGLLEASSGFPDFVERLKKAGYEVRQEPR